MENYKEVIINAWKQYSKEFDFNKANEIQRGNNQFHITESEFLYSLIRHIKPSKILEVSPDEGFTTVIILEALEMNNIPSKLFSFDVHDKSLKHNKSDGIITRELILGDAKETITDSLLQEVDFILVDSDHSYNFGKWYSKKFRVVKPGIFIMIHDWPMYASDGATNNVIAEVAPPAISQEIWNLEVLAVKQHFIAKGYAEPVLNIADFLKENKKPYYHTRDGVPFRALSPSQFLITKNNTIF
jgi:predicted O-methyltransferase YrrM